MDYQHHWDDILASGLMGSLIGFAAFKFIVNWDRYKSPFLPIIVAKKRMDSSVPKNVTMPAKTESYLHLNSPTGPPAFYKP
jgi:hypothetical protein